VVASIVSGLVTAGRVAFVIRWMPPPGILNAITSAAVVRLAEVIAAAREPAPVALLLITVNVLSNLRGSSDSARTYLWRKSMNPLMSCDHS